LPDNELYFLALIPPEDVLNDLWEIKQQVARKFFSKASLRSPPHVTLHMPFRWSDKKKVKLVKRLSQFCKDAKPFRLTLDGFGAFPPKVIYVKVETNNRLSTFQKGLCQLMTQKMSINNANYRSMPFMPHITIAFRDLKKSLYQSAWEYYRGRNYQATCSINQLTLLKHDTRHWQSEIHFQFGE